MINIVVFECHPIEKLSGMVLLLEFVDVMNMLGPFDGNGWFYCWYSGVLGTTREKSDELETLICH